MGSETPADSTYGIPSDNGGVHFARGGRGRRGIHIAAAAATAQCYSLWAAGFRDRSHEKSNEWDVPRQTQVKKVISSGGR